MEKVLSKWTDADEINYLQLQCNRYLVLLEDLATDWDFICPCCEHSWMKHELTKNFEKCEKCNEENICSTCFNKKNIKICWYCE